MIRIFIVILMVTCLTLQAQLRFNLEQTTAYHSNLTTDHTQKGDWLFYFSGTADFQRGPVSFTYQPDLFLPTRYHEFLNYSQAMDLTWSIVSRSNLNSQLSAGFFDLTFPDSNYQTFNTTSYHLQWQLQSDLSPERSWYLSAALYSDQYRHYPSLDHWRFNLTLKTFLYWQGFTFRPELEYGYKDYQEQPADTEPSGPPWGDPGWNQNNRGNPRSWIRYRNESDHPQYLLPGLVISRSLGHHTGINLNLSRNILIDSYAARPQNDETFYFYPLWDDRFAYHETKLQAGLTWRPDPLNTLRLMLEAGDRNYPSFRLITPILETELQRRDDYQTGRLSWSSEYCFKLPLDVRTELVYTHHYSNYWFYRYHVVQFNLSVTYRF
ncbi:MAG: hypothetical protein KBA26_05715 [Candidatus Delongbacteria bacterium]|nr:hypothetical protein [Candidatus Delongbacteria bacterium]